MEAVDAAGVPSQCGLVLRSAPVFRALRDLVTSGELGTPMAAVFRDDQYFPIQGTYASKWRADVTQAGGGCLIEHSIHDVDILRFCFGDVAVVAARTANISGHEGVEDLASVSMSFVSGLEAQLTSVWHDILSRGSTRRVELFCREGMVWLDDEFRGPLHVQTSAGTAVRNCPSPEWVDALPLADDEVGLAIRAYVEADRSFVDAVSAGTAPAPSLGEALVAHRLVDAAYHSGERQGERRSRSTEWTRGGAFAVRCVLGCVDVSPSHMTPARGPIFIATAAASVAGMNSRPRFSSPSRRSREFARHRPDSRRDPASLAEAARLPLPARGQAPPCVPRGPATKRPRRGDPPSVRSLLRVFNQQPLAAKVPEITAMFWVIKIATTAAGEAISDMFVNHKLLGVVVEVSVFCVALVLQFASRRYSAIPYWFLALGHRHGRHGSRGHDAPRARFAVRRHHAVLVGRAGRGVRRRGTAASTRSTSTPSPPTGARSSIGRSSSPPSAWGRPSATSRPRPSGSVTCRQRFSSAS